MSHFLSLHLGRSLFLAAGLVVLTVGQPASAMQVDLALSDLTGPGLQAQGVMLSAQSLSQPAPAKITIDRLTVAAHSFAHVTLTCGTFVPDPQNFQCQEGKLGIDGKQIPLSFAYDKSHGRIRLTLLPGDQEKWQVAGTLGASLDLDARFSHAALSRLGEWLPQLKLPKVTGEVNGDVQLSGHGGIDTVRLDAHLQHVAASDAEGLHAGEHIDGQLKAALHKDATGWQWQADILWQKGEVFWQPFYLKAQGQHLTGQGRLDDQRIDVRAARLEKANPGALDFSGVYDRRAHRLTQWQVKGQGLALDPLWRDFGQPLAGASFSQVALAGSADLDAQGRAGQLEHLHLRLDQATLEDAGRHIHLGPMDALLPWEAAAQTEGWVHIKGGRWQKLPIGQVNTDIVMNGASLAIAHLDIPVLDGALQISQLKARHDVAGWQGQLAADITPISMVRLSQALGWPQMAGTLSGSIPRVVLKNRDLHMDGALGVQVFDGEIGINGLEVHHPLGIDSTLTANAYLRHVDLGELTRAFSFGSIEGRLDGDVEGLLLSQWKPVRFHARLESSPGHYRKRISQQAVNNITAVAGGPMAGLQRTFLRFFKQFDYSKIMLTADLHDGVCRVDGLDSNARGFTIIRGGFMPPAINVRGLNHEVNWESLVDRIKMVISSNLHPVIR